MMRHLFFGYDHVIERMTHKLQEDTHFLAVLGPVGSGKSSVVQAGLAHKLRHGEVQGYEECGIFLVRLSGSDPFQQLEAEGLEGASVHLSNGIHVWSQENCCQRLVLILDQFEEVLRQCSQEVQQRFVEQLLDVIYGSVAMVILVLKDEFYSLLAKHEALMEWVEKSLVNVFAPHTKEDLLNIARRRGEISETTQDFRVIEEMVGKIIDQNQTKKSIIGMFELGLTQIAHYQHEALKLGQKISTENLLGRVEANLDSWAESIFNTLDVQQQAFTQRLFTQLILLGDESQGIPDTKRDVQISTLCEYEPDFEEAYDTLYQLAEKGLLITGRNRSTGHEIVSLAQDNLVHEWQRLKGWLHEYRQFLPWQKDFERRLSVWETFIQQDKEEEDVLLDGVVLAEAEMWFMKRPVDFDQRSQDFIQASQLQRQQKESAFNGEAKTQQAESEQEHQAVLARHLMTQSTRLSQQRPDKLQQAVLLAAESHARFPSSEADNALRQGSSLLPRPVTCISFPVDANVTAFSRDGCYVAVACSNSVEIVELATRQRRFSFSHNAHVFALGFDHYTNYLFALTTKGLVSVWRMSDGTLHAFYREHAQLTVATFSPDGRFIAVASVEGTGGRVIVWEVNPWCPRKSFFHAGRINSMAFNHTSDLLVTGHSNGAVIIWDIKGKSVYTNWQMYGSVIATSFSPGGQYLALASETGGIVVWDMKSSVVLVKAMLPACPRVLTFSPQGECLVIGSNDSVVKLWAIPDGHELAQFTDHRRPILAAAFSFDSEYLATAGEDATVYIWEMSKFEKWMQISQEKAVRNLAFSMDKHYLFTASADQTVRVWEVVKCKHQLLLVHRASVSVIACTMQGTLLSVATGCENSDVRVWTIQRGYRASDIGLSHQGRVRAIMYSPDGCYLATASDNHGAYLWDTRSGHKGRILYHKDSVYTVAFSPDSRYIVTGSEDGSVRVWETANGQERGCLTNSSAVNAVFFHQSSSSIIIANSNGTIGLWKWERGSTNHQVTSPHKSSVNAIAVSNDERYLATASEDWSICLWVWNGSSYDLHHQLFHEGPVHAVCFSMDGQYLASAGEDHCARLWDTSSGAQRFSLLHGGAVWSVAFTPDRRYLATASSDGTASIWETTTGRQILHLTHTSSVRIVSFSPDGKYLITGSSDGSARVWLWQPSDLIHEAFARVTHTLTQEEWQQFAGDEPYPTLYTQRFENSATNAPCRHFTETTVQTEVETDRSDEAKAKDEQLDADVQRRMQTIYEDVNAGRTENIQIYFDIVARFSRYSVRNQLLILEQMPDATYVLGPRTWEKHGYTVKKDEPGIAILAPYSRKVQKGDRGKEGEAKMRFGWTYVWDISQVVPIDGLNGEAPSLSPLFELETPRHRGWTVDQQRVKECIDFSIEYCHEPLDSLAEPVEYIAMRHFGLSREMPTAFVSRIAGRPEKDMFDEIEHVRDLANETVKDVLVAIKPDSGPRWRMRHVPIASGSQVHQSKGQSPRRSRR
jgi:WD40 repeat protein